MMQFRFRKSIAVAMNDMDERSAFAFGAAIST